MNNTLISHLDHDIIDARDYSINVWRVNAAQSKSHPWRYSVAHCNKLFEFTGPSNELKSKEDAISAGHARAKLLSKACYPSHIT